MNYKECKVCKSNVTTINNKYNLLQCTNCKLIFSKEIFSKDEFKKVYNELYNDIESKRQYATHSIKEYNELLKGKVSIGYNRKRIIERNIKKKGKLLEIGSGIGLIGVYLKKYNDIDYLGIEIDKKTHEKALKLGVNSINGDFSIMESLDLGYETVMMWEVLEHLQDLNLFLELVKKNIVKNGSLIFSVPNYNKRLNYNLKGFKKDEIFQSGPPIHLNFFTAESIKNILKLYNFDINFIKEKRFPYVNFKSKTFYFSFFKSLLGVYNGSTLYVSAKYIGN